MMAVDVKDDSHLTVRSVEVIEGNILLKSYNFYGWIESPMMRAPTPEF